MGSSPLAGVLGCGSEERLPCPAHPISCARKGRLSAGSSLVKGSYEAVWLSGRASCEQGRAPSQAAGQMGGMCAPDQCTMGLFLCICQQWNNTLLLQEAENK